MTGRNVPNWMLKDVDGKGEVSWPPFSESFPAFPSSTAVRDTEKQNKTKKTSRKKCVVITTTVKISTIRQS